MKKLYAVRGAVFAENTEESIKEKTCRLFNEVVEKNSVLSEDIVSLHFTITSDLDELNPATALRLGETKIDVSQIPLFCSQEAYIKGGRPKVIRLMLTAYLENKPEHIYIDGAQIMRPDFSSK